MKFLCRATDEKEWTAVEALYPDSAAEAYADKLEDDSAGEWLSPDDDGAIILVKISEAAEPIAFEIVADYVKQFLCYDAPCRRCGGKGMPANSCTQPDCPSPELASAHGSQPAASSRVAPSDANSGQPDDNGAGAAFDSIVNAK
jgi:hypothetical protein